MDLNELRAALGGKALGRSDEELLSEYSRVSGMSPNQVAQQFGYKPSTNGQWGNRWASSIDSYQANLYGVGEALGSDWARKNRISNDFEAAVERERAQVQGATMSMKDINGVGSAANWLGGLAVDSAPYLGEALAGGMIGRGLAVGAQTAAKLGTELGIQSAAKSGQAALARAGTAGAVGASYPSAVGDILSNQREQANGQMDLGSAVALGVPYAALNAFGLEGALARKGGLNLVSRFDDATKYGGLKRTAANGGIAALSEGASETGQEFINQAGRNFVDPTAGYFGPDALARYGESFVGGAALGGAGSATMGGWRRSEGWYEQQALLARQQAEQQAILDRNKFAPKDLLAGADQNDLFGGQYSPLPPTQPALTPDFMIARYNQLRDDLGGIESMLSQMEDQYDALRFRNDPEAVAERARLQNIRAQFFEHGIRANDELRQLEPMVQRYQAENAMSGQGSLNFSTGPSPMAGQYSIGEIQRRTQNLLAPPTPAGIEQNLGLRFPGEASARQADMEAALGEPANMWSLDPNTGFERQLDMGELTAIQTGQADAKPANDLSAEDAKKARAAAPDFLKQGGRNKITSRIVGNGDPAQVAQRIRDEYAKVSQDETKRETADNLAAWHKQLTGQDINQIAAPAAAPAAPVAQGAPNVSVANVSGQQSGGSSPAASPVAQGSMAGPGPDAPAAKPVPAPSPRVGGNDAKVPAGDAGAGKAAAPVTSVVVGGSLDFQLLQQAVPEPRMRKAIRLVLGVDAEGNRSEKPRSMQAAAQEAGLGDNSHAAVSKLMKELGITKEVRNRFLASDTSAAADEATNLDEDTFDGAKADDATPRTSDESFGADKAADALSWSDAGFGSVSDPGQAQGKVETVPRGALGNTAWYKAAAKRGFSTLSHAELAKLVAKASPFVNRKDSEAAIKALMDEVRARQTDRSFLRVLNDAYNEAFDATEVKKNAAEERADERLRASARPEAESEGTDESVPGQDGRDGPAGPDVGAGAAAPTAAKPAAKVVVRKKRTIAKPDNVIENDASGKPLVREVTPAEKRLLLEHVQELNDADVLVLEDHYDADRDSPEFVAKLVDDVVAYVNKGAKAVAESVRSIVGKLVKTILSVAVVVHLGGFSPQTSPEAYARTAASIPKVTMVTEQVVLKQEGKADTNGRQLSPNAQKVVNWIAAQSRPSDNSLVLDPATGLLYVMKGGKIVVDAPALWGAAGIKAVTPEALNATVENARTEDKITPSGRFAAKPNHGGSTIEFLRGNPDYFAIHAVYLGTPSERRQQRLDSATPNDNAISFGCVNVGKEFYNKVLRKLDFTGSTWVYTLPSDPAQLDSMIPTPDNTLRTTRTTTRTEQSLTAEGEREGGVDYAERRRQAAGRSGSPSRKSSARFSKGKTEGDTHTVESLEDSLLSFIEADSLGKNVHIVESASDLDDVRDLAAYHTDDAVAWTRAGHAYLIADRIAIDKERGVFLHEVGGHLGLERMLGQAQYNALVSKLSEWERRNDGSVEAKIAKQAAARMEAAGLKKHDTGERLAYFLEEAVNSGINPTAMQYNSEMGRWLRVVWAAFKQALRKLGVKIDTLTAQDVVDLAYGAARMNVTGRWHGTTAKIHQFSNKYMGTGEGAQAYGWGQYFSAIRGVAEQYREADVKRKQMSGAGKVLYDGAPSKVASAVVKEYGWGINNYGMKWAIDRLLSDYKSQLKVETTGWVIRNLQQDIAALEAMDPAKVQFGKNDGHLYGVEFNAKPDEFFDWGKPLSRQPAKIRAAFEKAAATAPVELPPAYVSEIHRDVKSYITSKALFDQVAENILASRALDVLIDAYERGEYVSDEDLEYLATEGMQQVWRDRLSNAQVSEVATTISDVVRTHIEVSESAVRKDMLANAEAGYIYRKLETLAEQGAGVFEPKAMLELDAYLGELGEKYDAYEHDDAGYVRTLKLDDGALTPAELAKLNKLREADQAEQNKPNDQRVSEYLDSQGVKGVRVPVRYTTGGRGERGYNYVVFNDRNVIRTVNNPADRTSDQVQFSRATPAQVQRNVNDNPAPVRPAVRAITASLKSWSNQALNKLMFTEDLLDKAKALGMKSADLYRSLSHEKAAVIGAHERHVLNIMSTYRDLPADQQGLGEGTANQYLLDTTRSEKWGYVPDYLQGQVEVDPDMQAKFEALSPKAQQFVKDALKLGRDTLMEKKRIVLEYTNSEYDALIAAAEGDEKAELEADKAKALKQFGSLMMLADDKPYSPQRRFGSHVVIAMSDAYKQAKEEGDTAAMRKMENDENHYYVDFVDGAAAAEALTDKLYATGSYSSVVPRKREDARDDLYGGSQTLAAFHKIRARLESLPEDSTMKAARKKMRELITDMYLMQLAEHSSRKSEMRRKNVAGDIDMIRSLETQGKADAGFLGSVQFNEQLLDALGAMRKEAATANRSTSLRTSEVLDEVVKRHVQGMDYTPTPWANKLARAPSLWFLATSPSYYLQNATQPWMMTLPVMAGRHDVGRAGSALLQAYSDLGEGFKGVKFTDNLNFEALLDGTRLSDDEKAMLNALLVSGKLDIGVGTELGELDATGGNAATRVWKRVDHALRGMQLKLEAINRLTSALAAHRLEMAKTKDAAKAAAYADEIVQQTHGDYSAWNAPRAFNTGFGKIALQFKKYQLIQLTLLAKLAKNSFGDAPKEEKIAARKALAFTLGQAFVLGGGKALPIPFVLAWLFKEIFGDDSDEPPEYVFRRMIGDKDIADLLTYGLINGSVLGGFGNATALLPFTDIDFTDRKSVAEAGFALLSGPLGGLSLRAADGVKAMTEGNYMKGGEALLPKGFGSMLKSMRITTDGLRQQDGDQTMSPDEIAMWDSAVLAMGLTPQKLAEKQYRQKASYDIEQSMNDQTKQLKAEFAKAMREGESTAEIRDAWMEFQDKRERMGFKRQPLQDLMMAGQAQGKREKSMYGNIPYTKTNEQFVKELADR